MSSEQTGIAGVGAWEISSICPTVNLLSILFKNVTNILCLPYARLRGGLGDPVVSERRCSFILQAAIALSDTN